MVVALAGVRAILKDDDEDEVVERSGAAVLGPFFLLGILKSTETVDRRMRSQAVSEVKIFDQLPGGCQACGAASLGSKFTALPEFAPW